MITEKSLVVYKNHPALVTEGGEKITITLLEGSNTEIRTLRVREKDVELLHPGPATGLTGPDGLLLPADPQGDAVREAWELLDGSTVPLRELAELVYGTFSPQSAWAAYGLLRDGLYFSGTPGAIRPRTAGEVTAETRKRTEKQQEQLERDRFLERLKTGKLNFAGEDEVQERRFLQDVEALAYGKTDKSRTLRELGKPETPQEAHRFLLACRLWTPLINPHPIRFGQNPVSPGESLGPFPEEDRLDLTHLGAYAIDNPYSDDPDDALSIDGNTLYVHVADPAAGILPGSPAEREAQNRGATLYLPEGPSRMLPEAALFLYALGLGPVSPALSFRIVLAEDGSIAETGIQPSLVKVTRLNYAEADAVLAARGLFPPEPPRAGAAAPVRGPDGPIPGGAALGSDLAALFRLAEGNTARRAAAGSVTIELPETHITVFEGRVAIEPDIPYRSAAMVRECMLLAGEGAALWASHRMPRLPFPYITQETGDLPEKILPGLAGSYQLRRCMRPRSLSVKPGRHWGLGLEEYTQVTSPLRRYTDLLAHQQIRTALRAGAYREIIPRGEDDLLLALAAGEAAAAASVQAERASRAHWTAVYLADKENSPWDGVILERKGPRAVVVIPALGLETQVPVRGDPNPNDPVRLLLRGVKIPEGEAVFTVTSPAPGS